MAGYLRRSFRYILVFFLFILVTETSLGQTAGINFALGFPQKEFRNNVDNTGYGLSGHFTFWTPSTLMPYTVGLNIGFITYGNESRNAPFSETIPDVRVDVSRSNNLFNFHALFQISPFFGTIRPYAEGLFGGEYLFTTTTIESEISGQEVTSSTNQDDFAWSYGGGGGILIKLASLSPDPAESFSFGSIWLDIKARYLFGTEAEYLREGSVEIENGKVIYHTSRSKTDLLMFHIGVELQI